MGETTVKTIKPNNDIVASMAENFKGELLKFIEEGVKELTVDINDVGMIDSVGLGVLIATHNSLQKNDGVLNVINASENIYKLFKVMRLDRHFKVAMA